MKNIVVLFVGLLLSSVVNAQLNLKCDLYKGERANPTWIGPSVNTPIRWTRETVSTVAFEVQLPMPMPSVYKTVLKLREQEHPNDNAVVWCGKFDTLSPRIHQWTESSFSYGRGRHEFEIENKEKVWFLCEVTESFSAAEKLIPINKWRMLHLGGKTLEPCSSAGTSSTAGAPN